MSTLQALLALVFLILLIIGFFSPRTSLFWLKSERTRKKSLVINGLAFLICFILFGAIVPPEELKNTNGQIKSKAKSEPKLIDESGSSNQRDQIVEVSEELSYNKIGDQIEVGNFSYKVNSARFSKSVGSEFSKQTADGIFLIVNLTFRNNDNEEHTLDNSFFKLTDEKQTEFSSSSEGEAALEMSGQSTLFLKQCNPHITKSGLLIFEVPDKGIYDLHLSGGFWNGKTAIVKLITQ